MELRLVGGTGDLLLTRLLHCLGVVFTRISLEQLHNPGHGSSSKTHALILSEEQLAQAHDFAVRNRTSLESLFRNTAFALIFPVTGTCAGVRALGEWIGGSVEMMGLDKNVNSHYSVATSQLCGPLSGLTFGPANVAHDVALSFKHCPVRITNLISIGAASVFSRIELPRTDLFVSGSHAVFDVDVELYRNIDAAACCTSLVPLLLFLRNSGIMCWRSPRATASIVLDDPNLTPTYGFIDFRELSAFVEMTKSAIAVAFIPWNYKRTSRQVEQLFLSHWPRMSLAIHGCDHTSNEFALRDVHVAQQLLVRAAARMRHLSQRTGLRYDKVMVFPQGKFSAAVMQALRSSDLVGVVNTELKDEQSGQGVPAAELLQPAVMCFSGFPLFLRRRVSEPIANFAVDALLGKPLLIVTHSGDYQRGLRPLASLVDALNKLVPDLCWTNLEDVVSGCISVRSQSNGIVEARLFSPVSVLESQDAVRAIQVVKRETWAAKACRMTVNGEERQYAVDDGDLDVRLVLGSGAPATIKITVDPTDNISTPKESISHRASVAMRRYLSEFRDNHVETSICARTAFTYMSKARSVVRKARVKARVSANA